MKTFGNAAISGVAEECDVREVRVRLVDEHLHLRRPPRYPNDVGLRNDETGRIVRARQEQQPRLRPDGGEDPIGRKGEVRSERHFHHASADACRRGRIHVERRHDDDGFRDGRVALAQRRDGQGEDALVEAVRQDELVGGETEPRRAGGHDLVVVRIEREVVPREPAKRVDDLRRAPRGVLVEV